MAAGPDRAYRGIVAHYEDCLASHGDNHLGVDWPRAEDADLRYEIRLGLIPMDSPRPVRLLDFGCGAGHLLVETGGTTRVVAAGAVVHLRPG